jgi:AraC-like DNA-binding protein
MNKAVFQIKTFLQENIYGELCLQDICAHFNLSKSCICNAFREETGKGIIEYYIDLKIQEAKGLIQKGDMNLSQIAEALGYMSIHHFSRSFKNRTGMSPSTYKKTLGRLEKEFHCRN